MSSGIARCYACVRSCVPSQETVRTVASGVLVLAAITALGGVAATFVCKGKIFGVTAVKQLIASKVNAVWATAITRSVGAAAGVGFLGLAAITYPKSVSSCLPSKKTVRKVAAVIIVVAAVAIFGGLTAVILGKSKFVVYTTVKQVVADKVSVVWAKAITRSLGVLAGMTLLGGAWVVWPQTAPLFDGKRVSDDSSEDAVEVDESNSSSPKTHVEEMAGSSTDRKEKKPRSDSPTSSAEH